MARTGSRGRGRPRAKLRCAESSHDSAPRPHTVNSFHTHREYDTTRSLTLSPLFPRACADLLLTQRANGAPPQLNDGGPCDDDTLDHELSTSELFRVPRPTHMPKDARSKTGLSWSHELRLRAAERASLQRRPAPPVLCACHDHSLTHARRRHPSPSARRQNSRSHGSAASRSFTSRRPRSSCKGGVPRVEAAPVRVAAARSRQRCVAQQFTRRVAQRITNWRPFQQQ